MGTWNSNTMKAASALVLLLQGTLAHAQGEAHRIIQERMAAREVPGMAFLIAREGVILDQGYYGKSNVEVDAPVSERSVWAIASMSKTYTAAAVLLMAEQGQLSLDDPIRKYLPEAPETWQPITIRHLLTHSSGMVEDWALYDWKASNELFLRTQTEADYLKVHFQEDLKFPPGTDVAYASGHFLLGVVIERITGEPYASYMEQHVFRPLGLSETYVDHPYQLIPNRVSGYFRHDPEVIGGPVSGIGNGLLIAPVAYGRGDAGIRTTPQDLMRFYEALFTDKLLNERSRRIMFSPAALDNGDPISTGPGWMNWPLAGVAISEHSGGFRTGFSSQALVVPEDRFMVIVLSNLKGLDDGQSGADFSLAKELAALYYPEMEPLSRRAPAEDPSPELSAAHLEFIRQLASPEARADVHEHFPYTYYSTRLKEAMAQVVSLTYLGERDVQGEEMEFFDVPIHTLRYYRLGGEQHWYTTVYLDEAERVVFVDHPERE